MVRTRFVLAALTALFAGCQCGFDSGSLTALACSDDADCAPDQDCIEGTCAQRPCAAPTDCGADYAYDCDEQGFCVADDCAGPEDCEHGLVCEGGFCRASSLADGGGPDGSLPDASLPDASLPDASLPDGSVPDASVDCTDDPECDDGDPCTFGDACDEGACTSTAYSCDDGTACTEDTCDGSGGCTNVVNCTSCPNACGALEECIAERCAPAPFGTGADGNRVIPLGEPVPHEAAATQVTGVAGQALLDLADANGFASGQVVLVHQTQGTGAGAWELARISSLADAVATLSGPLGHDYSSAGSDRAQAVVVPQYNDVTIEGTLTAPAWNGTTGGILALLASGVLTVTGAIDMAGRGFRGAGHACLYQCQDGFAGESSAGAGAIDRAANGAGGGGGTGGQDCGMGGGGGHGSPGGVGGDGSNQGGCGLTPLGGEAGAATGVADLDESIFLGAAGGEGGGDEDGANPGAGGNGGGIVVLLASVIQVTGAITTDGLDGASGDSVGCGGTGCGMGGGGGGAGGAIRVVAGTADLGAGLVRSLGGDAGPCSCGIGVLTGAGGTGRIETTAAILSGTTNPP